MTSEQPPETPSGPPIGDQPSSIPRAPSSKLPLEDLRLTELTTVQKGLAQMCRRQREESWLKRVRMIEWDRVFGTLALLLWGALIGGGIGFIPFEDAAPSQNMQRIYIAALVIVGLFALLATAARLAIKAQEVVSLTFLYEHVTDIIDSYPSLKSEPTKQQSEGA